MITNAFRDQHAQLKKRLAEISETIGSLSSVPSKDEGRLAESLVEALRELILPHADWEEAVLYPAIDGKAGGKFAFTGAMRHEHEIIRRRLELLADQALNPTHDRTLFARNADQLLGLVLSHFEDEEEVLLPVLDATMTEEEFRREILEKGHEER